MVSRHFPAPDVDIFGLQNPTEQGADILAQQLGARVVMPDFFKGKPWDVSKFPPPDKGEFMKWISQQNWEKIEPILLKTIGYLREDGAKKFGKCCSAVLMKACMVSAGVESRLSRRPSMLMPPLSFILRSSKSRTQISSTFPSVLSIRRTSQKRLWTRSTKHFRRNHSEINALERGMIFSMVSVLEEPTMPMKKTANSPERYPVVKPVNNIGLHGSLRILQEELGINTSRVE
jgi:hypothetical protein